MSAEDESAAMPTEEMEQRLVQLEKSLTVQIIDPGREVVATAQVTKRGECFAGLIDLSRMPASLREIFNEYEEIINGQMFSLLDEIEEQIGTARLKVVFEGGSESPVEEIQIYPSTRRVSFKLGRGDARE
jgi:hypothetical protein